MTPARGRAGPFCAPFPPPFSRSLGAPLLLLPFWVALGSEGAVAQLPPVSECGPLIHQGEASGSVPFPQGDLFCPLLADPKEPHTFASFLKGSSPAENGEMGALGALDTDVGSIGIGDSFGLFRWAGPAPGDGIQIGVAAGVFAQFDLASSSFDMLNADYVVGLPVSFRRGASSARVRLYHQSSHLGDEFLIREQPERVNLAFESLEVILSRAMGPLRLYGGGEFLFNREPDDLEEWLGRLGAEARTRRVGGTSLLLAVDVKSSEEQDWTPAWSLRGGVEAGWGRDPAHPPRRWSFLIEYYDGPSPYGQFYREDVRFFGAGIHVSL
ncbi:MAG: DUF1207 domain-containing protein [Gemmatimonadota bacterium]